MFKLHPTTDLNAMNKPTKMLENSNDWNSTTITWMSRQRSSEIGTGNEKMGKSGLGQQN